MKNLGKKVNFMSVLGVLLFTMLLTNCKTTETVDPPADLIIMGTWEQKSVNVALNVGAQTLVEYLVDQGLSQADAEAYVTEFITSGLIDKMDLNSDHTYTFYIGSSNFSGKWAYDIAAKIVTEADSGNLLFNVVSISETNMSLKNEGTFAYTDESIGLIEVDLSFLIEDDWVKL